MKAIDLFAGAGGLSLGFKQAGFEIVYANEFDCSIAKAYANNHADTVLDCRDINEVGIKKQLQVYQNDVDIVMGGPPCQGYSQKGNRLGRIDIRNYMFEKFFEVVDLINPRFFLIENVPNILTIVNGYFKDQIYKHSRYMGYDLQIKVLKSEQFGVPQIRRRAFILGSKTIMNFELPVSNNLKTNVEQAIGDLPALLSGEGDLIQQYTKPASSFYQTLMRKHSKQIYNHVATKHSIEALKRLEYVTLNSTRTDLPEKYQTKSIHSGTWTRIQPDGYARTITTRFDTPSSGQFTLPYQNRCITVREAARLQSFPDDFIFSGNKTSQMKQVGNAVPPMVALEIAKTIKANY
tara:strand:+ start:477 stop:1523 length:1047 start_codon:yes stop_codon:yes gene_type:complete